MEKEIIGDFIGDLEKRLVPQGTAPVVKLFCKPSSYCTEKFIQDCIDQIKKINALQLPISPLEHLGIQVLMDSAYMELNNYVKEKTDDN